MKLFNESIIKNLFEKWGIVVSPKNDGSKYGSMDTESRVYNDILGHDKVKKIVELEGAGAIIFQSDNWKIKTQPIFVTGENKNLFHAGRNIGDVLYVPSDSWRRYEKRGNV